MEYNQFELNNLPAPKVNIFSDYFTDVHDPLWIDYGFDYK